MKYNVKIEAALHGTEYVVRTSSAHMPTSCWGRYENVALLEVVRGTVPAMISARARGVVRIVDYIGKLHSGSGSPRTAAAQTVAEFRAQADELNAARGAEREALRELGVCA